MTAGRAFHSAVHPKAGRTPEVGALVVVALVFVVALVWSVSALTVSGQTLREADESLLRSVYEIDSRPFSTYMTVVNRSSYAAFALVPVGMWTYALAGDDNSLYGEAYQVSLAAGVAFVTTVALKHTVRRPRPYSVVDGVDLRTDGTGVVGKYDPFSFPSGHATISFALATSMTLNNPVWYIGVPAYVVATSIGVSRIWHGMHYPSDIFAGAIVGTAAAVLVWALDKYLVPARWRAQGSGDVRTTQSTPLLTLRIGI